MVASNEMGAILSTRALALTAAATIFSDLRPAFPLACTNGPGPEQFGEKSAAYQFRSQVRAFQLQIPHHWRLF